MIPIGRPRLGCLSILVVILAAVLYRCLIQYPTPNEYTNSDGIIHQLEESSNPLSGKNALDSTVSTESEPLNKGIKEAACTLAKVNEAPSLPIFLTFPVLRECKEVNILERILSKVRTLFGILLLDFEDSDSGTILGLCR